MATEKLLVLNGITKDYPAGDGAVRALRGVDMEFANCEFVSVLGPSGCGKTTLLNIIGGLDRYTTGDLVIRGRSTGGYSDRDWDSYRNHSIGFVFQSYNLIPHQTVLENVELSLAISGESRAERKAKARAALEKVGLADQINKRPNQLSGGQMQRVAIARAIVNDPDIILADEPTGALDSETSESVLGILKEISRTRLVIMVTHNAELAEKYSTRIIRMLDGRIVSDEPRGTENKDAASAAQDVKTGKTAMSFLTALSLSFRNLLTKKGRTILTSFAGSIGIIGIALILAFSNGIQHYIDRVQEDALSMYPLTLQETTMDMSGLMNAMAGTGRGTPHELDAVYSDMSGARLINSMLSQIKKNDLVSFKRFLETDERISGYASSVQYGYGVTLNIYAPRSEGYIKVNPSDVMKQIYGEEMGESVTQMLTTASSGASVWREMIDDSKLLDTQYEIIGEWPDSAEEIVLFINKNNEINDLVLYALGLKDPSEIGKLVRSAMAGQKLNTEQVRLTYEEILGMTFRLLPATAYYSIERSVNGYDIWADRSEDEEFVNSLITGEDSVELRIVGIARPRENTVGGSNSGNIGYTAALPRLIIEKINGSQIVAQQLSDKTRSVFTGMPFGTGEITLETIKAYIAMLPEEQRALFELYLGQMTEEQLVSMFAERFAGATTYEDVCKTLGVVDPDSPSTINIYASTFEAKENIINAISDYNELHEDDGKAVKYTDYVAMIMSPLSTIVEFISYALIVFVSISLVVSSIMIGIITYISVLERTKEIGILRAMGARKRDISRVFNAETLIIGLVSGVMGILVTLLLILPLNAVIHSLSGIGNIASLPAAGAFILVAISVLLTVTAGLIPARIASRKDPVIALRTE
ncbi:MAG: ABC transporter ATP-binding protein/permease [Clostridia bacterium]|nr:ABC transporter ATP-binding protein/permease [Clostridia bacterium]